MGLFRSLFISHVLINLHFILPPITATLQFSHYIPNLAIEEIIQRHIVEIDRTAPIHMVAPPDVNPGILQVVVSKYISVQPIYLAPEITSIQPCLSDSGLCPKLLNIVGIFSTIEDINPGEWEALSSSTSIASSKIAIWIAKPPDPYAIQEILKKFWSFKSLNVILLVVNNASNNVPVYSYDPFWLGEHAMRGRLYSPLAIESLYPDKIRNLRGYPIRISMYDTISPDVVKKLSQLEPSSDATILQVLSSWLNFTIDLKGRPVTLSRSYIESVPDGVAIGPMHDLVKNRSEVLGNSQLCEVINGHVEYVDPYALSFSRVLLPRPKMIPGLKRLFRNIDTDVYLLLVLFSIISAVYMYAKGTQGLIINTFRLLIHQQFHGVGSRLPERIFAVSWILCAYFFALLEQGHLVQNMTDPPFYKGITTLKELAASDIPIMSDVHQYLALKNSSDKLKSKIAERIIIDWDYRICLGQLFNGENIACIPDTSVLSTGKRNRQLITATVDSKFIWHTLRDIIGTHWRTILVKKGFPYLPKFNACLRRLRETGLIAKWVAMDRDSVIPKPLPTDDVQPLNLSHFEGPFKIFLLGMGIATCSFICEIVFHKADAKWRQPPISH